MSYAFFSPQSCPVHIFYISQCTNQIYRFFFCAVNSCKTTHALNMATWLKLQQNPWEKKWTAFPQTPRPRPRRTRGIPSA